MLRTALGLAVAAILALAACSDDTTDPTGGDPPADSGLDCTDLGYPCSLADSDPAQVEVAVGLLDDAWAQRHAGSMADALAWLQAQPDVVEVAGNDRTIRFRVDGCVPVWLTDGTGLSGGSPAPAPAANRSDDKAIVGEDTDESGAIDNRDDKRALVLAPYHWQFEPYDESDLLAGQLESVRGYAGNVTYVGNPDSTDQDVTLDHFRHWDNADLVYVSTHGRRLFNPVRDASWAVIYTGIRQDPLDTSGLDTPGLVLLAQYDGVEFRTSAQLGLTPDFFRATYPDGLDDTIVILSACETGGEDGRTLAEAMAGDRFVMFGWTEVVDNDDAFAASSLLMEKLGQGLTAADALQAVDDAGLRSVLNSDFDTTELERFGPADEDLRLFELPLLLDDQGAVLEDGTDITPWLIGDVDDGEIDGLLVNLSVDGVRATDRDAFTVRYRWDGNDLEESFDLAGAEQVANYRWEVQHQLDLAVDVVPDADIPLEVIVDLPEGGPTRFRVDVTIPGSGGGDGNHECFPYNPTPANGGTAGQWTDAESIGTGQFASPGDPGGGYWSVTATCDTDAIVRLAIVSGGGGGSIFSESNQGTESPTSITALFEAAPGWSYTAEARQVSVGEEDYPVNWTLSWSFVSLVDCYEPNQDRSEAKQLPLNINGVSAYMVGGHQGNSLDSDAYDDWYKFIVADPRSLEVELAQSPSDIRIRLRLWGMNDNQLASAGSTEPGGLATLTYEAQPGTYFLSVEAAALGDGAINSLNQGLPDHWLTEYQLNVRSEPVN